MERIPRRNLTRAFWIVEAALVAVLVLGCFAPVELQAPPSTSAVDYYGEAWLVDDETGCEVLNPRPGVYDDVTWSGTCLSRRAAGAGSATWSAKGWTGSSFSGGWRDGRPEGEGVWTWSSGDRCEGSVRRGKFAGHATCVYRNGARFEGQFVGGEREGEGTFVWPDGSEYHGAFYAGQLHGAGVYREADGTTHSGMFALSKANGPGRLVLPQGRTYDGNFVDGKPDGTGVWTEPAAAVASTPRPATERPASPEPDEDSERRELTPDPRVAELQRRKDALAEQQETRRLEQERLAVERVEQREQAARDRQEARRLEQERLAARAPTRSTEPDDLERVASADRRAAELQAKKEELAQQQETRRVEQERIAAERAAQRDEAERNRQEVLRQRQEARRVEQERIVAERAQQRDEAVRKKREQLAQQADAARQRQETRRVEQARLAAERGDKREQAERKRQERLAEQAEAARRRTEAERQRTEAARLARKKPAVASRVAPAELPAEALAPVAPAASTKARPTTVGGLPVMDFCARETVQDADTFQKSKVLFFNMGGLDKVEAGEAVRDKAGKEAGTRQVLASVGGRAKFEHVWWSTFPMRRFYNILAPETAPADFITRPTLTLEEVSGAFEGQRYGNFLARSVGCADYLAVTELTAFEAVWRQGERKKRVGKQEVTVTTWSLSIDPTVKIVVFRRTATGFVRVDEVEASGGGLFDAVTDLGAMTQLLAAPGNEAAGKALRDQVDAHKEEIAALKLAVTLVRTQLDGGSPVENALREKAAALLDAEAKLDTMIGLVEDPTGDATAMAESWEGGWAGLVSGMPEDGPCGGGGQAYRCGEGFWLAERRVGVAGMSERSGEACKQVDDEKLDSVAPCEVRVRAENIGLLAREASQGIEGWRLYAPLQEAFRALNDGGPPIPGPGISVGDEEGVERAMIFWAVETREGERNTLGFARVVKPGPGGERGRAQPTLLTWRAGGAELGTRMEEHPQIGVSLTVEALALTGFSVSTEPLVEALTDGTLAGVSVEVGYNLTRYTDWSWGELWLRTHLQLASGSAGGSARGLELKGYPGVSALDFALFNALVGPELTFYLLPRVDAYVMAAGGMAFARVSTPRRTVKVDGEDEDDSGTGYSIGSLLLGGGLALVLHPDWSLRIGVGYRQNLSEMELKPPDKLSSDERDARSIFTGQNTGTLSSVELKGGLTYIF